MKRNRFLFSAGAAIVFAAALSAQGPVYVQRAPVVPAAPPVPPAPAPPPMPDMMYAAQASTFEFIAAQPAFLERTVTGAPYSAETVSETTRVLADGTRIKNENTSKIYRDSEGRVRKEQAFGHIGFWVPEGGEAKTQIIITDPVAKKTIILNPDDKTARVLPMPPLPPMPPPPPPPLGTTTNESATYEKMTRLHTESPGTEAHTESQVTVTREGDRVVERRMKVMRSDIADRASAEALGAVRMEFPQTVMFDGISNRANVNVEKLGEQTIQGVKVTGIRRTTTIPTGAIGNDRPIVSVMEQWTSPELGVVLQRTLKDPQIGETVYRLENINRSEPLKSLFEVPSDYEIKEGQPHMPRIQMRKRSDGE